MTIDSATITSRRLEGIPKLPKEVRDRLALANEDTRLRVTDYRGSNIIPINFGNTALSGLTKEIFGRMSIVRRGDLEESTPILEELNEYFDSRDEYVGERLGQMEREELASFAGGSILLTLEKTGEILDDFHGAGIYKNKLESLRQYVGLVIREQGIVEAASLPDAV